MTTPPVAEKWQGPVLFPDFDRKERYTEADAELREIQRWTYVQQELARMARERTLYLTDVLNQPTDVRRFAEEVIAGVAIQNHQQVRRRAGDAIETYRVRIRSLCGETVKWCEDIRPSPYVLRRNLSDDRDVHENFSLVGRKGIHQLSECWVDSCALEVDLLLYPAMLCLKAAGKFVKFARHSGVQKRTWKWEEVKPEQPTPQQLERADEVARKELAQALTKRYG